VISLTTLKELKIKGGIRESFREGTSKLADRPCYGFSQGDDSRLVINKAEAKNIRWIFERYLASDSLGKIADGLAAQGIASPTGNQKWNRQALNKLLSNEKYAGYALLQKTVTEGGRQIRNKGQVCRYLYHDNNPAIISIEEIKAVQEEKLLQSPGFERAATIEWRFTM
jgi:hypothetical protein